jgi:hypothetical protein
MRPDIVTRYIRCGFTAALIFFVYEALEPVVDGSAQEWLSRVAILLYLFVALWVFDWDLPARKPKEERPSAVRARLEAVNRRKNKPPHQP